MTISKIVITILDYSQQLRRAHAPDPLHTRILTLYITFTRSGCDKVDDFMMECRYDHSTWYLILFFFWQFDCCICVFVRILYDKISKNTWANPGFHLN